MNDWSLQKLKLSNGKLSPDFNADIFGYKVTVTSEVFEIAIECRTSDRGSCYTIKGCGDQNVIQLIEGKNIDIIIEVTSEDGTTGFYMLHVLRLSSQNCNLNDIELSEGIFEPSFNCNILEYNCYVPFHTRKVKVIPLCQDPLQKISVNDAKEFEYVTLNASITLIDIDVQAPDDSSIQRYSLKVINKPIPVYVKFLDQSLDNKYSCPITLNCLYQPVCIFDDEENITFTGTIIDEITKTRKCNPLTDKELGNNWRHDDYEVDRQILDLHFVVPLIFGGNSEKIIMNMLPSVIEQIACETGQVLDTKHDQSFLKIDHTYKQSQWERAIVMHHDVCHVPELVGIAMQYESLYIKQSPKPGYGDEDHKTASLELLKQAVGTYAAAIELSPYDDNLHLRMAFILEECYYAEEMYGLKKSRDNSDSDNQLALSSSKDEECEAICEQHGLSINASAENKLKAIDNEYKHLIDSGQSSKADHVMSLYKWKSKTIHLFAKNKQEEVISSYLEKALEKYTDAVSLDQSNSINYFHVGRLLIMKNESFEAIKYFRASLNLDKTYKLAQHYLGIALSMHPESADKTEIITYLKNLLLDLTKKNISISSSTKVEKWNERNLFALDLIQNSNIYILEGVYKLAEMIESNGMDQCMESVDIYHTVALYSTSALGVIAKGTVYLLVLKILIKTHYKIININFKKNSDKSITVRNCESLLSLISHFTIFYNDDEVLALRLKICQILVSIQPSNSKFIRKLGDIQFCLYNNNETVNFLNDSIASYKASISLENTPITSDVPGEIQSQHWWSQQNNDNSKKCCVKSTDNGSGYKEKQSNDTVIKNPIQNKGAKNVKQTDLKNTKSKTVKQSTAAKNIKVQNNSTVKSDGKRVENVPKDIKKIPASDNKVQVSDQKENESMSVKNTLVCKESQETLLINPSSYHARLGLARALSKKEENINQAKQHYLYVIKIEPTLLDAYIECVNLVRNSDIDEALQILSSYPIPDQPSFDDAYIFMEIINILSNHKNYDDERLVRYMILAGKVLGIPSIENYVYKLEEAKKMDALKQIFAGIHEKSLEDEIMVMFFISKYWM